jgi:GT2 family glycosyltransferase
MMFRRDVIEKVGTMTEAYFLFYEEFDWCHQMEANGYKLFYEATSVVYHKGCMTIKSDSPLRAYYLSRGRIIFARRYCVGWRIFVSYLYQIGIALWKSAGKFIRGDGTMGMAIIRGTFDGFVFVFKNATNNPAISAD